MKKYIQAYNGEMCQVDLSNPFVMIKGDCFGEDYRRGSLVYPIALGTGGNPGHHHSEGWMTVSTLNTDTANFCGVEVGKTVVSLKDLIEISGNQLGISNESGKFTRGSKKISRETAINEMLDYFVLMQLPAEVRASSRLSRVISSEPTQSERGIIFDKLEDLAAALGMYDMGLTRSSTATRDRLYADMWKEDHPNLGVDDPSIFRTTPKAKLISLGEVINRTKGSLVENLISAVMNSGGNYRQSFDYDGMGTAFFKTSVEVERIDGKYVLSLCAAYVGDKPEEELAQTLGRERGLVRVSASHQLTSIAQDWIGVDVSKAMKGGKLTLEQIDDLIRSSAGESQSFRDFIVKIDNMPLKLSFGIGEEENYKPDILLVNGSQLYMRTAGEGKPYLSLSLSPSRKGKIVSPDERAKIVRIRDGLSELVQKNLS